MCTFEHAEMSTSSQILHSMYILPMMLSSNMGVFFQTRKPISYFFLSCYFQAYLISFFRSFFLSSGKGLEISGNSVH